MSFTIITDATCDLPKDIVADFNVKVIPMSFMVGEKEFSGNEDENDALNELYSGMRQGKKTSTAQITPQTFSEVFLTELKKGNDILYLGFSSALSSGFNNAKLVADEMENLFPDRKIFVIDSLAASIGQGMFVYNVAMKTKGKTVEQAKEFAENLRVKIWQLFTVDDLNFLCRGGRLSKAAAIIGTMLQVKPILCVNTEGQLVVTAKALFRKKSIMALAEKFNENYIEKENEKVMIAHADCIEDAKLLESLIKSNHPNLETIISLMGPIISSHTGPGTLAISFVGKNR